MKPSGLVDQLGVRRRGRKLDTLAIYARRDNELEDHLGSDFL